MLNILYLTKNVSVYKAANYQLDFINALSSYANVFLYGPGFDDFSALRDIKDVLRAHKDIDIIFVGHEWLNNGSDKLDPAPMLGLAEYNDLPKYVFLNKEYARLKEKLKWISNVKPKIVFTHHWDMKLFRNISSITFKFIPFACDTNLFKPADNKKYHFSFSGVLQNSRGNSVQSDFRLKILNELFVTFLDVPLFKRKKYRGLNIFWNTIPRTRLGFYLSIILRKYRGMSVAKYADVVNSSVYYLNSLSPLGLVSPRYYECVAAKAVIISEHNDILSSLIGDDHIQYIKSHKQLYNTLMDHSALSSSFDNVNQYNVSWEARVTDVLRMINNENKV